MIVLFAVISAWGAEIQVEASRPVVVAIDGRPAAFAGTRIDKRGVSAGQHHIQVRSFVGSLLAETVVRVEDHDRIRLIYDRTTRTLTEVTRAPLSSESSPASTPSSNPTDLSVEPAPVELPEPVGTLPPTTPPETLDSPTGSVMVTGVSDLSGAVTIAGQDAEFASSPRGFLATLLTPPAVEVHIEDNGKLRFHGAVDVVAGGNQSCHLHFRQTAWTLRCDLTGPELK